MIGMMAINIDKLHKLPASLRSPFLYATGSRNSRSQSASDEVCPDCGAVLEEDEESGDMICPVCE